jgi:two-component system NtrC family sensor kinase
MGPSFSSELLERFSSLVSDLPDAVRLIDRSKKILVRNEASDLLAPNGLGHLCGEDTLDRNPSCPACQVDEVLERGTFLRWHVSVPRDEKSADYFEVTLSPVRDSAGRIAGVLEILRDATATLGLEQYLIGRAETQDDEIRKHSEEADRLSAELGELRETQTEILERDRLRALNQLVAGISHEINTPLGAMLSSADLLRRTVRRLKTTCAKITDGGVAASIGERVNGLETSAKVMVEAARRIQAVVRTLRLFSRLDEAALKQVDLREGIETSLELLQYRIRSRIKVVKSYGKIPELLCRPDALNQVFMNLLLNAVQAIETEGIIHVATRLDGDEVVVQIEDDGVGIPAQELPQIFDLGYTSKGGTGGAGIGLALTRRIVREHGGSIDVESRPGEGTTFTVRLPLKAARRAGELS